MSSEVEILKDLALSHYKLRIIIGVEPKILDTVWGRSPFNFIIFLKIPSTLFNAHGGLSNQINVLKTKCLLNQEEPTHVNFNGENRST